VSICLPFHSEIFYSPQVIPLLYGELKEKSVGMVDGGSGCWKFLSIHTTHRAVSCQCT